MFSMITNIFKYLLLFFGGLILVVLFVFFVPSLWRHWVTYPQLEAKVFEFQKLRKEPARLTTLNTYRGLLHFLNFTGFFIPEII